MDLNTLLIILNVAVFPLLGFFGFLLRRAYSRLEDTVPRGEIRILIEDKLAPLEVMLRVIDRRLDLIEKEQHLILQQVKKNGHY